MNLAVNMSQQDISTKDFTVLQAREQDINHLKIRKVRSEKMRFYSLYKHKILIYFCLVSSVGKQVGSVFKQPFQEIGKKPLKWY